MDIPTSIKATTVWKQIRHRPPSRRKRGWVNKRWKGMLWPNARNHSAAWPISSVPSSSYQSRGYFFRDKTFGKNMTTIKRVEDSAMKNKNTLKDRTRIEREIKWCRSNSGWQLFDANTSDELWHKYLANKGTEIDRGLPGCIYRMAAVRSEPYLDLQKNVQLGVPRHCRRFRFGFRSIGRWLYHYQPPRSVAGIHVMASRFRIPGYAGYVISTGACKPIPTTR